MTTATGPGNACDTAEAPAEITVITGSDRKRLRDLHTSAFGPGRFARTAYRVRESGQPDPRLDLCVTGGGSLIGAVQFTPIQIGSTNSALLLGPLVIDENHKNQGWGLRLMLDGLLRARELGYRLVVLVGDPPYYARAGFLVVPAGQILLPGPVDTRRLLYAELAPGAIGEFHGPVRVSQARPMDSHKR